jgi:hypothetical protein
MFDSNNVAKNFPGYYSSSQITQARALYATMTGRVTAINGTNYLNEDTNAYKFQGAYNERFHQREMAAFVSDSWRLKPGLTVTYGARWEVQLPVVALRDIWSYSTVDGIWGLSGPNSMFVPGASGGQQTQVYQYKNGDTKLYNTDWKSVAPSLGIAWSPNVKGGFLEKILGSTGKSVFRGGYSIAYNRYGMSTLVPILSSNIGSSLPGTRSTSYLNFPVNGCTDGCPSQWPVLFSQQTRLVGNDLTGLAPTWPMTPTVSDSIRAIDPNIRTPYTMSWSIGYQREISKDMAIEFRYVANRNYQSWDTRNMNGERNIYQDSFKTEFNQAMANLAANLAFNNKATFAYTGAPGTGPLPLAVAFWQGKNAAAALIPANYTSSNFTNTTLVNALAPTNAVPSTYASNLDGVNYRQNAINAGVAANYFRVNPAVNGANLIVNGGYNYYDSAVVELRRRLSKGLLVQANYVFAKSLGSNRVSFLRDYIKTVGGTLPHTFKVNWLYEMPWGNGKPLLGNVHGVFDRIISNWELQGIARMQSGNMIDLNNLGSNWASVRLVGMTLQDVANSAGLQFYDSAKLIYNQPEDIRLQTINAFSTSGSYASGYSSSVPTGRYIAPASSKNCIEYISGDCAPYQQYFRGPKFFRVDLSLVKRVRFTESKNFELRGEFLNAFNNINFTGNYCAGNTQTCGLVSSAWRDTSNTGEQGGRSIQIQLRLNF